MRNELIEKRIGTRGVVGGIGHRQNVLVLTRREPLDPSELRIFELFSEQFEKVVSPGGIVLERDAETFDRCIVVPVVDLKQQARGTLPGNTFFP